MEIKNTSAKDTQGVKERKKEPQKAQFTIDQLEEMANDEKLAKQVVQQVKSGEQGNMAFKLAKAIIKQLALL